MPMAIRRLSPPDRHAPILSGERAVLSGMCGNRMTDQCHILARLGPQYAIRGVDLSVPVLDVWCQLALNYLRDRNPPPPTRTQQFVCPSHRLNAPVECGGEIRHSAAPIQRLRHNSADRGQHILDAMVKLYN